MIDQSTIDRAVNIATRAALNGYSIKRIVWIPPISATSDPQGIFAIEYAGDLAATDTPPYPEKIDIENPQKWYPVEGIKMPDAVDCEECNGDGIVQWINDYNEYEANCKSCDGTGRVIQQKPVDFNGITFDQRYLALLSELPNCEIGLISKTATTPFRFDGGTGIIMPMQYPVYLEKL